MKKTVFQTFILSTLGLSMSYAQEAQDKKIEEIVISDTKFSQKKEKSGKIIEKITSKDLEARQGQSVAQVLNQVAGLEINGSNSSTTKNLEYYLRGGRSRQVLIVIDGIPVNDASSIATTYDLRLLAVEQVESIEILKGSSSVLYGSGAATGVINITTKKAGTNGLNGNAYFNVGTQNTVEKTNLHGQELNQGFSISGNSKKVNFATSLNSSEVNGISEAAGINFERDYFSRLNLTQKLGFKLTQKISVNAFVNYDKLKSDYDGGAFVDEAINLITNDQIRIGFSPKYTYKIGELILNSGFSNLEKNISSNNTWASTIDETYYKSRAINADLANKINIINGLYVITGIQAQYMDYFQQGAWGEVDNKSTKFNIVDTYTTIVFNSKFGFNINIGSRMNMHNVYGNHAVYNINPSFNMDKIGLKIVSSYSTAYIAPSLYQLYSEYGNLELKPEENSTAEFGFEKSFLNKKIVLNAVGFYREEFNKIDWVTLNAAPWGQYQTIDDIVRAKGVEVGTTIKPIEKLNLTANYTFTEVEELQSQLIPKHKVNAGFDFTITSKINWSAQYQYTDLKSDLYYDMTTFSSQKVVLDAYQIVNSTLNIKLNNTISIFGNVTNLFDVEFVEKAGYNTRGRNYKVGLNLSF